MAVKRGRPPHPEAVTPAEARVLDFVKQGLPNAEIAVRLGISVNTVRYHVSNLITKAGVGDRRELRKWSPRKDSPRRRWGSVPIPLWLAGGAAAVGMGALAIAAVVGGEGDEPTAAPLVDDAPTFPKYEVSVFAGDGTFGSRDGKATEAQFRDPRSLSFYGGTLYVAEVWSACLRSITPDGTVTTVVESMDDEVSLDGTCEIGSRWGSPSIAMAQDERAFTLRKTLRQQRGFLAMSPFGALTSAVGSDELPGGFTTVTPWGISYDGQGNLFATDMRGGLVHVSATGTRVVIAPGEDKLQQPMGVVAAPELAVAFVADRGRGAIVRVALNGDVTTIAGGAGRGLDDGPAAQATFSLPTGLALDGEGNLWITDNDDRVRVLTSAGSVFTVATGLDQPYGIAIAQDGSVYVTESGDSNRILKLTRIPDASAGRVEATAVPSASSDDTIDCPSSLEAWLCEFAHRTEREILGGGLAEIVRRGVPARYECGEGLLPESEFSPICEGAHAGDIREGFDLALHGSEGGPHSAEQLLAQIGQGITPLVAAIGCPVEDPSCTTFVVAFAPRVSAAQPTPTVPSTTYLAFRRVPDGEPAFIGAGQSGDNASEILSGQITRSVIGETRFVVFQP